MSLYMRRQSRLILILFGILALSVLASYFFTQSTPFSSVEVAVAESSPNGEGGGYVLPASCESYGEHYAGECSSSPSYGQGYYQASYGASNSPSVSASQSTVMTGEAVTISWACGAGDTSSGGVGFATGGATSGSVQVIPSVTANYGVQCYPSGKSTTIAVTVRDPELSISVSPVRVHSGSTSLITWNATSVTSCTLTGTGVNASCSGLSCANVRTTTTGALTAQSIYTLTCLAPSGSRSATATVSITPRVCETGTVDCPE